MMAGPLPAIEQLYDAAPCGHLLAAAGGPLLHVNNTLCRWLQYDRAELLEQVRLPDLLTSGGRIFFHTHLQPLLRMQGSVSEVKLEVRRKDGQLLPMIFNMAEQAWQGATLLHVAAFIAEDRHKYERELMAQRQRAEELLAQHTRDQQELAQARGHAEDRALFAEQLVGIVSHDIRNPLAVIQMSGLMLERSGLTPQQQAAVERISRAVGTVQHLIGDLLDFTETRLGPGLRIRRVQVDLHASLADSIAQLAVAFPGREIRHLRSGPGDCQADPERMAQAVGNLLGNAAKHGAATSPITVETRGTEDRFEVSVHNLGTPIPAALLPRLFEPMVRGAPTESASKGVGLGLYIVREIARAHGGSVAAESSAESGSRFTISIPRA
jgi:sigma-B regulation protein RsbU (phosphoserine phosphatase)